MSEQICDRIQATLAERGPTAFQEDVAGRQHLVTCDECFAVLDALGELDGRLARMPALEPSDALVERVLAQAGGVAPERAATPSAPTTGAPSVPASMHGLRHVSQIGTWPARMASRVLVWVLVNALRAVLSVGRALRRALRESGVILAGLWRSRLGKPVVILGGLGGGAAVAAGCLLLFVAVGSSYRAASVSALGGPGEGGEYDGRSDRFAEIMPAPAPPAQDLLERIRQQPKEKEEEESDDSAGLDLAGATGLGGGKRAKGGKGRPAREPAGPEGQPTPMPSLDEAPAEGEPTDAPAARRKPEVARKAEIQSRFNKMFAEGGAGAESGALLGGSGGGALAGTLGSGFGGLASGPGAAEAPSPSQPTTGIAEPEKPVVVTSSPAAGFFDLDGDKAVVADTKDRTATKADEADEEKETTRTGSKHKAKGKKVIVLDSIAVEGRDQSGELVAGDDESTVEQGQKVISGKDLERDVLENMSKVATQARIVPSFENGRPNGFKLFSIKPGSFYARLGLQNGDVIQRINGQEMNSPDKALDTYEALKTATAISVDLQRRGQGLTFTCKQIGGDWICPASLSRREAGNPSVRDFFARWGDTSRVSFRDATGYWANTYVPGDPDLRLLQLKLAGYDRGLLTAYAPQSVRLDDMARQHRQPFDPPEASALAVYLHATERGLTEPKRMIVQVGMQATPRHSGRRPTMNVGVVLDLRGEVGAQAQSSLRALIESLAKARDLGDRFALVVAGKPGGLMVEPDLFRHGPLTVAAQKLFGSRAEPNAGPTLSVPEALETAYATVGKSDDPTSQLGSSVVILVTALSLGSDLSIVEQAAHQHAVDGIPLSVIGLGAPDHDLLREIDRLVLAGQGNRRLLGGPNDAGDLVQRELSAVSRVVARAVRLRIRLAAGVKLVDVLGSYRLDEVRAEQVRQAEKSIDLRMSRNLGIEADRGEDEEGIQIVIPSFFAGDSHVFLLDVVAEGPGPVADVTVRYKDLVFLKNGVARDNLTLERRAVAQGPLERNVLKNLLAYELSRALDQASEQLRGGDHAAALASVTSMRTLVDGMRREIPGLFHDRDLTNDSQMLGEYALLLDSGAVGEEARRTHIEESLRYAGLLKLLPRPEKD